MKTNFKHESLQQKNLRKPLKHILERTEEKCICSRHPSTNPKNMSCKQVISPYLSRNLSATLAKDKEKEKETSSRFQT